MIAIYNLEPKYFNLALEKVRKFYEDQGETVDDYKLLWHDKYDKIYCSSIFTWTDKSTVTPDMICGGTGFDLATELPSEIEAVKVRKNKGFTTRGCIRNCSFCVVPKKEGKLKRADWIGDFWDGKSDQVELYDNNWLADRQWFFSNSQFAIDNRLKIKENGMDIRLLNDEITQRLAEIKWAGRLHFAWDQMENEKAVERGIKWLNKYNINNCMFYILVNYDTTIEQDLYRRNKINEWGYDAFVMLYDKPNASRLIKEFARWNNRFYFRNLPFSDYLKARKISE
jgi:hypothetical protein